jgi:hypothetical protein
MVNPRTKALMVVYDDIQAIYKGRERPVWSQLGIEAKGRMTVLKVNYRNTDQIVAFARRFASDVIGAPGTTADDEHAILLPEDAGRQGLVRDVQRAHDLERILASLLQGTSLPHDAATRQQFDFCLVGRHD